MPRIESQSERMRRIAREIRHRQATSPFSVRVALHVFFKGRRGPRRLPPFSKRYQVNPRKNPESQLVRRELIDRAWNEAIKANTAFPAEDLVITLKEYKVL